MAFYPNEFPLSALRFNSLIKKANRNPKSDSTAAHFIVDGIDTDFRVQGIIDSTSTIADIERTRGYKYIIADELTNLDVSVKDLIEDNWRLGEGSVNIGDDLGINDIIVWNDSYDLDAGTPGLEGGWELVFDANNSAFGASGGAFIYSIAQGQFYGFTGGGWGNISSGTSGDKGETGDAFVYGRNYIHNTVATAVNETGEIFVANSISSGIRRVKVHKFANDATGFGGATGDLTSIFFPFGIDAQYDTMNPPVSLFLYNETKEQSFGIRVKAKADAYNDSEGTINFQTSNTHFSSYEILNSEPSSIDWANSDVISLLALADGVMGATGAVGATGTGITLAATSPEDNELIIQFIGSDGTLGATAATGIVSGTDGVTGEAGEVGFEMTFTGGSATDWSDQTYATGTALTAGHASGGVTLDDAHILYVSNFFTENDYVENVGFTGTTQDYILVSYVGRDVTGNPLTYLAFGLNNSEYAEKVKYNKPGEVYFYEKEDYQLKLRSFVSYESVLAGEDRVVLKNVLDDNEGASSIGFSNQDIGYVLPVPRGIRGQGITFGGVVDNELYLDYIDSQGNTFGRFATGIKGITGNQGTLNPFNIPFAITADSVNENGTISISARDGSNDATQIRVDGLDRNGVAVDEYIQYGIGANVNRGYLTVFDETDVSKFGIFRFTSVAADGVDTVFSGSHVAGPLSAIYDVENINGVTGLTLGANALFALNLDGIQGQSGVTGVGFTYGNEYFISTEKPVQRTNGDDLEIGDKWFNSAIGIEFTFLGATGMTGAVVTSPTADIRWVQTNNARQGRQGPQGIPGVGTQGVAGATGVNWRGNWSVVSGTYYPRDIVFIARSTAVGYNSSAATNWDNYFNSYGGVTAGIFINTVQHTASNSTVPGAQDLFLGFWRPFVFSSPGFTGNEGPIGIHGTDVTGPNVNSEGELTFTLREYDENGDFSSSTVSAGYILGPTGPTGPVGGNVGQFMYNAGSNRANGTSKLRYSSAYSSVILESYIQPYELVSYSPASKKATVDPNTSNTYLLSSIADNSRLDTIDITLPGLNTGENITIFIEGARGFNFNGGSTLTFTFNNSGVAVPNVYVSKQSATQPTRMIAPVDGEGAVMSITVVDYNTIFVNYVLMKLQS